MGSDAAAEGHGRNLVELRLMHELGMSAPDVLRAATSSAAELMGIADRVGSIETGKRADLTLVAGEAYDFAAAVAAVREHGVWLLQWSLARMESKPSCSASRATRTTSE